MDNPLFIYSHSLSLQSTINLMNNYDYKESTYLLLLINFIVQRNNFAKIPFDIKYIHCEGNYHNTFKYERTRWFGAPYTMRPSFLLL